MNIGDKAIVSRTYTTGDLATYQEISQANAPSDHVPEPLIGALFSNLLGEKLPGYGTNYLKQEMRFHQSASLGESLSAEVKIIQIRPDKQLVDLETSCTSESGQLICSGRALVLVKDVAG